MRPYLVEWLNRAFHTTAFTYVVPNYLVMLAVAVIAGTLWAARRARAAGLDPDAVYGLALWAFPSALLGARLLAWLRRPWGNWAAFFDLLHGAMVAYGGFIAAVVAAAVYTRRHRLDSWRYFDCAVPGVGLGTFLTRLGCFLDGDDFRTPTSSLLAVRFPAHSPAFMAHVEAGLLSPALAQSLPLHPVQLYLALNGLLLGVAAGWWSRRPRVAPGEAFCLYWLLYACGRFALEFLRGDASRGFVGPLSTSQAISIPVALLAALGLLQRRGRRGRQACRP